MHSLALQQRHYLKEILTGRCQICWCFILAGQDWPGIRHSSSDQSWGLWLCCWRTFSVSFGYLKWKQRYSHSSPQKHFCKLLGSYRRQRKKISQSSHGKNIKFSGLSQINKQIILRLRKLLFNDLSDYQRLHRACLAKEQKLINRNISLWAVPH